MDEHAQPQQKYQNRYFGLLLGALLLVVGGLIVANGISSVRDDRQPLIAPNGRITIEIADDADERTQGLSGRETLGENEGMLFVFDSSSGGNCFWMKDMQFAIDMVWIDEQKNVVTVREDVSPDTYPTSFCPETVARYGLEINSKRAAELGIEPGIQLRF